MTAMPLDLLLSEQLLTGGYSDTYDGYASISGIDTGVAIRFTRKTNDALGRLRLPVGREYSDTLITLSEHCPRCSCTDDDIPLPPAESLTDRNARVALMDALHVGTATLRRLDTDPSVIAPGWFTERFPYPTEPVDAEIIDHTPGPNTGVLTVVNGTLTPTSVSQTRTIRREPADAGRVDAGSAARLAVIMSAGAIWGWASGVHHIGFWPWLIWLVFQSCALAVLLIPRRPRSPLPSTPLTFNDSGKGPQIQDDVARPKLQVDANLVFSVLRNGKMVREETVYQNFDGATQIYHLYGPKQTIEPGETLQLAIHAHVIRWALIPRSPERPRPPVPPQGGTRDYPAGDPR